MLEIKTEQLTPFTGKNAKYEVKYADSNVINKANYKTCKTRFLDDL
jgi:hypothetical protein